LATHDEVFITIDQLATYLKVIQDPVKDLQNNIRNKRGLVVAQNEICADVTLRVLGCDFVRREAIETRRLQRNERSASVRPMRAAFHSHHPISKRHWP
jgi:hypothetical protein